MNYIIQLQCINSNNNYNIKSGQIIYISEVFGQESKCVKDKDRAYERMTEFNYEDYFSEEVRSKFSKILNKI